MEITQIIASNSGKIAIINNHGGNGHKAAVELIQSKINQHAVDSNNDRIQHATADVFQLTLGKHLGNFVAWLWNYNQKKENIRTINFSLHFQGLIEPIIHIPAFFGFLKLFTKNQTEVVVSPQHIALKPMSAAVRLINLWNRRFHPERPPMVIRIIMTELPNKDAVDFNTPFKTLRKCDWRNIEIYAGSPLLENKALEEDFWVRYCNIPKEDVAKIVKTKGSDLLLPIRQPFYEVDLSENPHRLSLNIENEKIDQTQLCSGLSERVLTINGASMQLELQESDKLSMILLGSQASTKASLNYITSLAANAKERSQYCKQAEFVTVLCSNNNILFNAVVKHVAMMRKLGLVPENFHVIPLMKQDAVSTAQIMFRSDTTITKAGGLTAMELSLLAPKYEKKFGRKKEVLIHAVLTKKMQKKLLEKNITAIKRDKVLHQMAYKGMIRMETGNYLHLKHNINARLTTPYLLREEYE